MVSPSLTVHVTIYSASTLFDVYMFTMLTVYMEPMFTLALNSKQPLLRLTPLSLTHIKNTFWQIVFNANSNLSIFKATQKSKYYQSIRRTSRKIGASQTQYKIGLYCKTFFVQFLTQF
jgi:hypothetical protein